MESCDEERDDPGGDSPSSPENKRETSDFDNTFRKDTKYSWVVCFAGFFIQVIVVGFLHVFGIFFIYFMDEFKTTKATTAWLGSITYGLNMAFGCLTGLIEARIGTRPVLMIGSAICTISLIVSSFAPSIEVLFFTFSVIYGIGSSFAYTPTMCLSQIYFDKHVSFATGIMVAGSSTGTLILSPITQALLESIGWRNSFRVFAGFLFTTIFSGAMVKPIPVSNVNKREHHSQAKQFLAELKIWKDRVFILWTIALAMSFFGYFIIGVHLVSHAVHIGLSPEQGATLMMCLGGFTAIGRVMWGKIVQWRILNRVNLHQASMIITGTGYMMLPFIKSYGGLMAYCCVHGLVDGCFVVLLPIVTSKLVGSEKASVAWGFLVAVCSLTFMTGPPMAGLLSDATGSYDLAFHIAAIPLMIAALLLFLIPWAQRTARTTNSLHEIRSYIPFPEHSDSDEGEQEAQENISMSLLTDDYSFEVISKDEVRKATKYVHFADLDDYGNSRWRSTGQIGVKRNKSLENQPRSNEKGHRWRRRCISESVEAYADSEPLDLNTLKPIREQSAEKQQRSNTSESKAVDTDDIILSVKSPNSSELIKENITTVPMSPKVSFTDQFLKNAVESALEELTSTSPTQASANQQSMACLDFDQRTESGFAQPATSWEGGESLFAPQDATSPFNSDFNMATHP